MALVRGKYGIEFTPRPTDDDSSGLGWILVVVSLVAVISLAATLIGRLRSSDEEIEEAAALAAESLPAPAAKSPVPPPAAPPHPKGGSNRPTVRPDRKRPAPVASLLLRLEEAKRTRDVEMEASTIEQLREQHASEIADIDDSLARRLGDLNFRRLFRDRNRLWVNEVVVKSGDSASRIAAEHGSTLASLLKLNSLASANKIMVGQKLKVLEHPRFVLDLRRGQRFADLMLNGKFFRRYELLSDVTAPAGEYETASRLRTFLPAKGVEIRPADVAELELLLLPKTPMKVFAN